MATTTQKRNKALYKKFLRLRVNPLNNNKIEKFKKQKWRNFLELLKRNNKFYKLFKPYSINNYKVAKFASPGNSFKRKFRNDLFIKKTFNYFYGHLLKKYLKKNITKIYRAKKSNNFLQTPSEYFESRLDSILHRTKFCYSIKNARQLITHKHIKVNNRIEMNRSYILKPGDLIQIAPSAKNIIKNNLKRQLPSITTTRLDLVLYEYRSKSNFNFTIEDVHDMIDKGYVRINGKVEKNKFYVLSRRDRITVHFKFHGLIRKEIMKHKPYILFRQWPTPPSNCVINYNTLEIIFGDNKNSNFTVSYHFRLDNHSVVTEHYRH